jgi:hypothetical protein
MTSRHLFPLLAAACLLTAAGRLIAQAPPTATDTEQRLKALEDKMDRVLKLLEAKESRPADANPRAALEAKRDKLRDERDKLRDELAAHQKEYTDFRVKSSGFFFKNAQGTNTLIAERLGKYEARRSEQTVKMRELADQLPRVERAYKEGGPQANRITMQIIKGAGVKTEALAGHDPAKQDQTLAFLKTQRQTLVDAYGEGHQSVKEADAAIAQAKKTFDATKQLAEKAISMSFINTMKEEIQVLATNVETLTNLIDAETKLAKEVNAYEVTEDRLRSQVELARKRLAEVEAQIAALEAPAK